MECDIDKNLTRCNCTYDPCSKKGKCCECITYHWRSKEMPGCFFPPDAEATFDRSLRNFIEVWKDKV